MTGSYEFRMDASPFIEALKTIASSGDLESMQQIGDLPHDDLVRVQHDEPGKFVVWPSDIVMDLMGSIGAQLANLSR